jgi:hypothetical protein
VLDDLGREAMAAVAERSHADTLSDPPLAPDPVSVTMPFLSKVDGFLTRFAVLCARKASSESPHGYTSSQDSEKDCTCGR